MVNVPPLPAPAVWPKWVAMCHNPIACRSSQVLCATCRDLKNWWPESVKLRAKVAQEVNKERQAKGLAIQPQPPARLFHRHRFVGKQTADDSQKVVRLMARRIRVEYSSPRTV